MVCVFEMRVLTDITSTYEHRLLVYTKTSRPSNGFVLKERSYALRCLSLGDLAFGVTHTISEAFIASVTCLSSRERVMVPA